ncbi:MAG: DUF1846 domain-containing protein [Clostridia bacterium]|nr:DUF1846 domain-containing protein [Clostridia bacterium]
MSKLGFDNDKYIKLQSESIRKRIAMFDNKLYLEFGGKLFDDYHASRVLPGFSPNAKIHILTELKDQAEIIFVISAGDIERNKIRADFGITYDMDVMRLMDNLRRLGIYINSVVITQYAGQPQADVFKRKLEMRGERVYVHRHTKGYPTDVNTIVSDEGYGANPYIETTRPLVVVTAPGPGSGKLATCLSQMYHEYKMGIKSGYAKFETFPIWNIPLKHPVNIAYEAATADLGDFNVIDSYHLEAYGHSSVNYNRDIEVYPVLKNILTKITGDDSLYKSPTDMGVNMAGYGISDDEVCRNASKQEVIRRYLHSKTDYKKGICSLATVQRMEMIMSELCLSEEDRLVVSPAREKSDIVKTPAMAIMLEDGRIVTGKQTDNMECSSTCILNALKVVSNIDDSVMLLRPEVLEDIMLLKREKLGDSRYLLNLADMLVALSISATTDKNASLAVNNLDKLKFREAHCSHILTEINENTFRKLSIHITTDPVYPSDDLFYV